MSAFKAGQTVWRHKTQLVRGCAERAAKLTSPIQEEILQSGYWGFSAETYCLAGLGSLKIGNQHNMQYNSASFPTVPKPPQNAFLSVSAQILISPAFRFQTA